MIPLVGIDLGTTFSCVSYINEEGTPAVIKNADGGETTPSVIWFDGKLAYVGKKANDRKLLANSPIYEFVKRDIGKTVAHRYVVDGYDFGACGLSAIILKKLKQDAFYFFKRKGWLGAEDTPQTLLIPAVITVPAYFRDKQRYETKVAGMAAGLEVIAIVNEPTAAALTYGLNLNLLKRILVFDLGGGTFDVTLLEIGRGEANVIATDGADELGGKDFDKIIKEYLLAEFERQTSDEVPDDLCWEIDRLATESKITLSDKDQTSAFMNTGMHSVEVTLHRQNINANHDDFFDDLIIEKEEGNDFFFEERAQNLLAICKAIMNNMLEKAGFTWNDIDEVVPVGGASQMPMITKMLEELAGKKIMRNSSGYSVDTAIAQGAALYGRNREKVIDVSSKSVGIEVRQGGKTVIEHLIRKNMPLPVHITQVFPAEENAVLQIYEGEDSTDPNHCVRRGSLELGNPVGPVSVELGIDIFGTIHASVDTNGSKAELRIKSDQGDIDVWKLKSKIDDIDVRV